MFFSTSLEDSTAWISWRFWVNRLSVDNVLSVLCGYAKEWWALIVILTRFSVRTYSIAFYDIEEEFFFSIFKSSFMFNVGEGYSKDAASMFCFSLICRFIWSLRWPYVINAEVQPGSLQTYGLNPVCERICVFKFPFSLNLFPHSE